MSFFSRRVFAASVLTGLFSATAFAQDSSFALPTLPTPTPQSTLTATDPNVRFSVFQPVSASETAAAPAVPGTSSVHNGVRDVTESALSHGNSPHSGFDPFKHDAISSHSSHGNGHGAADGHGAAGHGEEHQEAGLYGFAEYLLMRARRGAFDFAVSDSSKDLIPNGKLESLNYELRSGFRAGLGYRFKQSPWGIGFNYTYLRTGADRTLNASTNPAINTTSGSPTGLLYATLTRPGIIDNVGFAQASASLEYNVFDIEVSRKIHVDEHLNLRLFGGARFATIRQDFDVLYDLRDANMARVRTKSNFDGFGPMMGAEGALKVWGGFHLYGRTSVSLLTGRITNPYNETQNNGLTTLANIEYRTRRVIPTMGAAIAGGWQGHNVAVRVGYEMTHWTNLIDTPRFTSDFAEGKITTRTGDLSLEGLFVQFAVSY